MFLLNYYSHCLNFIMYYQLLDFKVIILVLKLSCLSNVQVHLNDLLQVLGWCDAGPRMV